MRRRGFSLSASAIKDLRDIAAYLEEEAGSEVASRVIGRLDRAFERLLDWGQAGVARDGIAPGLRMQVVGRYVAYFKVGTEGVVVLRVLHGRRDRSPTALGLSPQG